VKFSVISTSAHKTMNQAIQLIDRGSFHRLICYCRPGLAERDIPKRQTLRAEVLRRAQVAEGKVHEKLSVRHGPTLQYITVSISFFINFVI
jgi:hypothetical protein